MMINPNPDPAESVPAPIEVAPKLRTEILPEHKAALIDPCKRSILAHEPTGNEVRDVFISNPTSQVIISPNGYYVRKEWV